MTGLTRKAVGFVSLPGFIVQETDTFHNLINFITTINFYISI